ncbi:non-specific serine/threonine protein kinase [Trifolium repens]|nr:non-specific serine/threonine protein kinase [Trifolium repens]
MYFQTNDVPMLGIGLGKAFVLDGAKDWNRKQAYVLSRMIKEKVGICWKKEHSIFCLKKIVKVGWHYTYTLDKVSLGTKQLIYHLLQRDPSSRLGSKGGANDIKNHSFFRGVNWALVRCTVT